MSKKMVFGIDLGTTNSCLSRYFNKKCEVVEIDGGKTIPSVIAWSQGEWLVGQAALNSSKIDPQGAIASTKRHMGERDYTREAYDKKITPQEVATKILSYMKLKASEIFGDGARDVVITVPAYFLDHQRQATIEAGKSAGWNVLRIVNEPTAASLSYQLDNQGPAALTPEIDEGEKWLVYDLGGGTFDVSLLVVKNGHKEVLASCGNNFLGGDDFDLKITERLLEFIRDQNGVDLKDDPVCCAQLKHWSEAAKIALSTDVEYLIKDHLHFKDQIIELNYVLKRIEFEQMIEHFIQSTLLKVEQVLNDGNCESLEISKLLLVGGSTRIPSIRKSLQDKYGLEGLSYVDPDLSVALGASILGATSAGLDFSHVVIDVVPHSLGVAAMGELDRDMNDFFESMIEEQEGEEEKEDLDVIAKAQLRHPKTFAPIIRKNAKLPTRFVESFYTACDNQEGVEIAVYQGESPSTRENQFVGSFMAELAPLPAKSEINLSMEYDLNGMIKLSLAQSENSDKVTSFKMDLKNSVMLNSDGGLFAGDASGEGIDDDCGDNEGPSSQISNFLIQRVDERVAGIKNGDEIERIKKLKDDYQELLKLVARGDETNAAEEQLDELEDQLYSWLEEGASSLENNELH